MSDDQKVLPCDVMLPPATRIGAGCSIQTLLTAIEQRRERAPQPFTVFDRAEKAERDLAATDPTIDPILAAIRETTEKATPGEWYVHNRSPNPDVLRCCPYSDIKAPRGDGWDVHVASGAMNADAAHIAACSPAAMAKLLAHVDALTERVRGRPYLRV